MKNCLIVLNYNDFKTTSKFIQNVKNNGYIDKIVIVDNNSNDNSYELLLNFNCEKIDVIKTEANKGYADGNNYGMKYAYEKYKPKNFIISNPDVIFDERIINNLAQFLEKNNDIALATGVMHNIDEKRSKIIAWKLPRYIDDIKSCFYITEKYFNRLLYEKEYFNNQYAYVDVVPGSFFMVKADIMNKIDYFDSDTFLYCEERILGWKLKNINFKSAILCKEKFIHAHSTTIKKNIKSDIKRYKILKASKLIYMKKYLNCNNVTINFFKIIHLLSCLEKWIIFKVKSYRGC